MTEQGWVSNFSAVWQVASTLAIVACLLALPSQRNSSEWVWTTVMNRTGYPQASTPYVCMLGLLLSTFTLSGYDAGARMSEETTHASKVRIIYVHAWSCPLGLCGNAFAPPHKSGGTHGHHMDVCGGVDHGRDLHTWPALLHQRCRCCPG